MNDSYLLHHERCPQCTKLGRDNSHDNLGVYSDGHSYCFSCGYHHHANKITRYVNAYSIPTGRVEEPIFLPRDSSIGINRKPLEWLEQYEITNNTLTKHMILWSDERQLLIFPYFINGTLVGWQGRYFGPDQKHPKWFTKGKLDTFVYTLGKPSDTIVLVEDIVSAIKVSRHNLCSPIFGSVISNSRYNALSHFYSTVIIWLDPDKQKEAIRFAKKGELFGLNTKVVLAEKDPKEFTYDEIKERLDLL